jgi:glycosyltransferase involved in cell wall biosynthesis
MKKVVWISSYLPRSCGIAFYSHHYISNLKKYAEKTKKKINFKIIAHTDAKKSDYPIIDNTRDRNWIHKVLAVVRKENPDIVHIQHEYGLYETYRDCNKRVLELIELIRKESIPVVMTYHSVYSRITGCYRDFVEKSLRALDAGIFHEEYQKQALKQNIGRIPINVFVLPHGSREDIKLDKNEIKKDFGYNHSELVVGSAGLADERKGFRTLVKQWSKVVKKVPNAVLALEVKPHAARETRIYINKLLEVIMKSSASKSIEFTVKDYSEMEFYKRLTSFDVLVLPYRSESQSGVLAHGFSTATPAIVTDIEGLGAEIRNSKAGLAVKKRQDFWKAIVKMLEDPKLRAQCSKNAINYVKKTSSWNIIAKKTFEIYEKFW